MTLGEAKKEAVQHMIEYTRNGTPVNQDSGAYQDYVKSMNPNANSSQMELCKVKRISAVMTVSQNPITNLLGLYGMNEEQHFPGNNKTYSATGVKSFSVEVDGPCNLRFEEQVNGTWQDVSGTYITPGGEETAFDGTIAVSGIKIFTNYRGLLASSANSVRLTVIANYPIKSRYRGLFAYAYPDAENVPRYAAYVPYQFPSDFMEFDKMMRAYNERQYTENIDYKGPFRNRNGYEILINWHLTGQFDIHYFRYPTVITNDTPDTYEFEVDIDAQTLIPWFMAGHAIYTENANLGTQLLNQYYALKESIFTEDTSQPGTIVTGGW